MRKKLYRLVMPASDVVSCIIAYYFAAWLRFDGVIAPHVATRLPVYFFIAAVSLVFISMLLGCYNSLWHYIGFTEIAQQGIACLFSGIIFLIVKYTGVYWVSGSITVIYCGMIFILTSTIRCIPYLIDRNTTSRKLKDGGLKRAVIIGAGATGAALVKNLREGMQNNLYPIALLDDDPAKRGLSVAGVRVCGAIDDVVAVCARLHADEIIVAIPSVDMAGRAAIYEKCLNAHLPVRMFQSMIDMKNYLAGDRTMLREVSIEDLLFRDSVETDMTPVFDFLRGKTVLVTGGVGSIGAEICRQVLRHGCGRLIIFDIHENGMFVLNEELKSQFEPMRYELCIGSVREPHRLREVFEKYRPQVVFHAAAHKHVPMMEINPCEAIKNNVTGTRNVLDCCAAYGSERFVLISTDKAVHPTNVMGATKRLAELLVQTMNGQGGCEMVAVRFGNVLGSSGSVIPLFKQQIAAGGPVTVTHPDMKRYFMTIPEAVSLVLSAGALAHGGELFVLDMGTPVRIYELAETLIRLSGLEPGSDIAIEITGLRPGEKLFEELALDSESVDKTSHHKIFIVHANPVDAAALLRRTSEISACAATCSNTVALRKMLFAAIGEKE